MPPNRLFHYQPFKEEYLASLLLERKVKLSRPNKFNDPWDCRVHYQVPTDSVARERVIKAFRELHRTTYPAQSEAERDKLIELNQETAFSNMEKYMYEAHCKRYRVYCLSEKPDMPLLWAHYANSHTGICLEFDAQREPFAAAEKVRYLSAYPAYDILTPHYESLFTKSKDWCYEAEWRLIAEELAFTQSPVTIKTKNDFLTIPRGVLRSVTIGCLTEMSTRRQIERLIVKNAPSVLIKQATVASDRYGLIIHPVFE